MVSITAAASALTACLVLICLSISVESFRPISTPLALSRSSMFRDPVVGSSIQEQTHFKRDDPLTVLFGKKAARKGKGGGGGSGKGGGGKAKGGQQQQQEKKSVQDQRFDAATRQFMFTMVGLTKMLPDKSKNILKNINLSFYPGAKIGVGKFVSRRRIIYILN